MVVVGHLATQSSIALQPAGEPVVRLIYPFLSQLGELGVTVFFVISGYVITRGLIMEQGRRGVVSIGGFYRRRFFRIVPPLALYIAAVAALCGAGFLPPWGMGVWKALTFTCNVQTCGEWFGGHTWSLSFEEQFYAVIPLLFVLLWRVGSRLFFALPFILTLLMVVLLAVSQPVAGAFVGHFIAISAGVACAAREDQVLRLFRATPRSAPCAAALLIIVLERLGATRLWPLATAFLPWLIAYVLLHSSYLAPRAARALSARPLTAVGQASYSIYLWQQLATYAWPRAGVLSYAASVCLCVVWALVSYRWIEKPLIDLGRKSSHPVLRALPSETSS